MPTPINIIIDNRSVIDDVIQCDIDQAEGQYCSSVSLSLKSKSFWALCDPTTNFGALRIKVVIGVTTYQFLVEERDTTPSRAGVAFTVWGRSKQALLSKPYSKTINDTDDTSHPWQTGNTTASAIVAYVVSNYCPYSVTVNWNAGDFAVYADSFSVSGQSPVDVISSLAGVIGAELVAAADGSLSAEAYSVDEGASVQSYNDLDDIVQLSESIDYPSGYNAVTVYGYGSSGTNATIAAERYLTAAEKADGDFDSNIYPGRDHTVRVYYYHSQGDIPTFSFPEGSCQGVGSGTESITEDVTLIFGKGNTSKTNTNGETAVTGDTSIPITTVSVTYSVNYQDYSIRGGAVETYNVLFYFADKSAYAIYSFSVVAAPGGGGGGGGEEPAYCASVMLEEVGQSGRTFHFRAYAGGASLGRFGSSDGTMPDLDGSEDAEELTESITLSNGSGSISKPFANLVELVSSGSGAGGLRFTSGSKAVTNAQWEDIPRAQITITYTTIFTPFRITVGSAYKEPTFSVWLTAGGCDSATVLDFSLDFNSGGGGGTLPTKRDITINITDYVSDVDLDEASVSIDGSYKGTTDASGLLNVSNVAVGDHTIKITKSGYQDSDQDDLANDTFTVSAS